MAVQRGRQGAIASAPRASPKVAPPASKSSAPLVLDASEVVAAVESLYDDELKPFGRILRKRVAERAFAAAACDRASKFATAAATKAGDEGRMSSGSEDADQPAQVLPNVDMRRLRAVCDTSPVLKVECEDGGDWCALIIGREAAFVDVYDPEDVYSDELWEEIAKYFDGLAGTKSQFLPGGRYSCAQALVARKPPFLAGLSMGRVCHVVQLAISQKKILGYLDGAVVPYVCSQSMMKEQQAEKQLPYSGSGADDQALPFASLQESRACVHAILDEASSGRGPCTVPLSNIKRLFRSRFGLELSETMLGHSKLSELLQDERFVDVCTIKLAGHGYVVVPKEDAQEAPTPPPSATYAPVPPPPGLPPPPALASPGLSAPCDGIAECATEMTCRAPPGLEGLADQENRALQPTVRRAAQGIHPHGMPSALHEHKADLLRAAMRDEHESSRPALPTLLSRGPRNFHAASKQREEDSKAAPMQKSDIRLPMRASLKNQRPLRVEQNEDSRAQQSRTMFQAQSQREQQKEMQGRRAVMEHELMTRRIAEQQYLQHMQFRRLVQSGVNPTVANTLVQRQGVTGRRATTSVAHLEPAFLTLPSEPREPIFEFTVASTELLPR